MCALGPLKGYSGMVIEQTHMSVFSLFMLPYRRMLNHTEESSFNFFNVYNDS